MPKKRASAISKFLKKLITNKDLNTDASSRLILYEHDAFRFLFFIDALEYALRSHI